ncbi:Swi3-domain-containing protein [Aspergillus japonicus CBS 114.51]|uniref:Chromosome segregation in meiosis protein n=2 Tax=Aspergillus TaxID=5052 RepID=A0A2V5HIJ6_ASPV1|nr:Swi3-domain-containing protein [Aspergillus japonicus CBS 114.51]PYI24235.1 Swi3-domain-containing protein [Aspergillus violaceofuscus CBS 115571]RAH82962.1 Swi3-domain-containing protein [Aspergillus japonicus CBS 114.51]
METSTEPLDALTSHDNSLFDYDAGLDAAWQQPQTNITVGSKNEDPTEPILGVDDKVQVSKHRRFVAKLDESRLLSHSGIPKLRRTSRQRLRLKGKGHEFSDVARLLNFYQLWLDDLYPRAKFADGLAMIEKLGHSKRLQTMRREWIDEEKPKALAAETNQQVLDDFGADMDPATTAEASDTALGGTISNSERGDIMFDLAQLHAPTRESNKQIPESRVVDDTPEDDELDVLLREFEDGNHGA